MSSNESLIAILNKMVKEMGSQRKVAEFLQISDAYLSDILKSRRPISDVVAQKLNYRRVIAYEKMEEKP